MDVETEEDRLFRAWRDTLPPAHWSTYDLAACRIGWDAGRKALGHPIQGEAVAWVSEQQLAGLRQGGQVATLWSNAPAQDYVPLFASQPPTPAEVREEAETLLIYLRGCLSREDGDGMIDVPADYIKRAIPLVAAAKGATP